MVTTATKTLTPLTPIITATTVTDNSQQQQQQQLEEKQQENIPSTQIDNSNSVHLTAFLQTDDHISLAESVRADTVYDSVETIKESSSPVNFAVGSPVSAPVKQQLHALFTHNISSLYIDGKDSSLSEANRRRIQYVSQPTLFDECNSSEHKRVHYRYQSGVSDLSLDTDENEDTLADFKQMPAFGDLTMDQDMEPVRRIMIMFSLKCKWN